MDFYMKKIEFIDLGMQYSVLKEQIDNAISTVLEKGNFIQGEEVKILEKELSEFTNSKCLTVANGTDALFIALKALGIKDGDEIITPSFTWVSTVEAIKLLNATPVYVDISLETFNINPDLIENHITEKTKVILPVSIFGRCADLTHISKIANKYNLKVLEDAAQSFGAKHKSQLSCSIADISTTSFFPAKPLGCYGDGGAIFTQDEGLYEEVSMLSKHGQKERYNYKRVGFNSRLDTIQAAILIEKLKVFESEIISRNNIASLYNSLLSREDLLLCPNVPDDDNRSVWAQYTILLDESLEPYRENITRIMKEKGIPTALYYPVPIHTTEPYFKDINLEITEMSSNRVLSLPMSPYISDDQVEFISDCLLETIREISH